MSEQSEENPKHQYIDSEQLISHTSQEKDIATIVAQIKERLILEGDKPDATVKEQLELLEQLQQFDFGRFLLENRGINGVWTRHMVLYPKWKTKGNPNSVTNLTPLEYWLLEKAPTILATQERFTHFQNLLQEHLKSDMKLASVPCGMMDDLITLNFSEVSNIKLVGIDLDIASLEGGKETAEKYHLQTQVTFLQKDAWQLTNKNEFDIITSNGLNIYEPNDDKVLELYQKFHTALKPNGILITSFLTPPSALSPNSSWAMEKINEKDLRQQKIIFSYILAAKWQTFRTEAQTIEQLKKAGFKDIKIIYDKYKMFPTVLATS